MISEWFKPATWGLKATKTSYAKLTKHVLHEANELNPFQTPTQRRRMDSSGLYHPETKNPLER